MEPDQFPVNRINGIRVGIEQRRGWLVEFQTDHECEHDQAEEGWDVGCFHMDDLRQLVGVPGVPAELNVVVNRVSGSTSWLRDREEKNRPTSHFHVGMGAGVLIPGPAAIFDDLTGCDKSLCEKTGIFQMGKSPIQGLHIAEGDDELNVAAITKIPDINLPPSGIIRTTERGLGRV